MDIVTNSAVMASLVLAWLARSGVRSAQGKWQNSLASKSGESIQSSTAALVASSIPLNSMFSGAGLCAQIRLVS